jgi:hypothetical protein
MGRLKFEEFREMEKQTIHLDVMLEKLRREKEQGDETGKRIS